MASLSIRLLVLWYDFGLSPNPHQARQQFEFITLVDSTSNPDPDSIGNQGIPRYILPQSWDAIPWFFKEQWAFLQKALAARHARIDHNAAARSLVNLYRTSRGHCSHEGCRFLVVPYAAGKVVALFPAQSRLARVATKSSHATISRRCPRLVTSCLFIGLRSSPPVVQSYWEFN